MLDDLRSSASTFIEEEENAPVFVEPLPVQPKAPDQLFLGMTAPQRFVLSLMLFLMVSVLGLLLLVITDKMVINLVG
jgi:hypothetical protein